MRDKLEKICGKIGLGAYQSHEEIVLQPDPAWKVTTSSGAYFVKKLPQRELELYSTVEKTLNGSGVRQARLFYHADDIGVFEFLSGKVSNYISAKQSDSMMVYFAHYNRALKEIPCPDWLTEWKNPWDRADSLKYVIEILPDELRKIELSETVERAISMATGYLELFRETHETLPKQLVHGDPGPGNVMFDGDEIVAIIDMTPYLESHLYSLCVSLYWPFIYFNEREMDARQILRAVEVYDEFNPLTGQEKSAFHGLFIKAATRMLVVQLNFNIDSLDGVGSGRTFSEETLNDSASILLDVIESGIRIS